MLTFDYYYDDQLTGTFEVIPNDTATSRAFIEAMRNTSGKTTDVNHSFFRDKSEIVNTFLRMKEVVRLMNATEYDRKIDVDLEYSLSQTKLQKLHQFFEDMGERIRTDDLTDIDDNYDDENVTSHNLDLLNEDSLKRKLTKTILEKIQNELSEMKKVNIESYLSELEQKVSTSEFTKDEEQ